METETITIEQFIKKRGIRFECRSVDSRPDGLMSDHEGQRHFRCKVIAPKHKHAPANSYSGIRSFSLYFSQGSAHISDPTLAEVLDCLASDASDYENATPRHLMRQTDDTCLCCGADLQDAGGMCPERKGEPIFAEWANEYGYDTDSRKAEKVFRTVKRQAEQLKRTLGAEAYEELLWNVERL